MGNIKQIFLKGHERWLDDERVIWRYVPLQTLFLYLAGKIFIPSIEKLRLTDPFEGEFYFPNAWFNKALKDHYQSKHEEVWNWLNSKMTETELASIRRQNRMGIDTADTCARLRQKHYFDFLRQTRHAWCWFASGNESAAMWNTYGLHGVAIASTVGSLRKALSRTSYRFTFGQMRYVSVIDERTTNLAPENPSDAHLILHPHFLKRNEYQSENEVRFVTTGSENPYEPGMFIDGINPATWIHKIHLWPKAHSSEVSALQKAVKKFSKRIPCEKSKFMSKRIGIGTRMMSDLRAGKLGSDGWINESNNLPEILKHP